MKSCPQVVSCLIFLSPGGQWESIRPYSDGGVWGCVWLTHCWFKPVAWTQLTLRIVTGFLQVVRPHSTSANQHELKPTLLDVATACYADYIRMRISGLVSTVWPVPLYGTYSIHAHCKLVIAGTVSGNWALIIQFGKARRMLITWGCMSQLQQCQTFGHFTYDLLLLSWHRILKAVFPGSWIRILFIFQRLVTKAICSSPHYLLIYISYISLYSMHCTCNYRGTLCPHKTSSFKLLA